MTVMKGNKKTPVQIHAHLVARRKGIAKRLSEPSRFPGKCMVNLHKPHAFPGKCCSNSKEKEIYLISLHLTNIYQETREAC